MEKTNGITQRLWVKALLFFLVAVSLAASLASGILASWSAVRGWYGKDPETFLESDRCRYILYDTVTWWSNHYASNGQLPEEAAGNTNIFVVFRDEDGEELVRTWDGESGRLMLSNWQNVYSFATFDSRGNYVGDETVYIYADVYVADPLTAEDDLLAGQIIYDTLYAWRRLYLPVFLLSLAVVLIGGGFLFRAAGHHPGTEESVVTPGWQEHIPLDLYLAAAIAAGITAGGLLGMMYDASLGYGAMENVYALGVWFIFIFLGTAALCTVPLGWLLTLVVRIKLGDGLWWRSTLLYRLGRWLWRLWHRIVRCLREILGSLPLVWRIAMLFIGYLFLSFLLFIGMVNSYEPGLYLLLLVAINCLAGFSLIRISIWMRQLQRAGAELARGNLDYKVDVSRMRWDFRTHGENLNSISEGLNKAVEDRMHSERFKTDLITNVSHDIKTPLTSIINYVDLLKKENLPGQQAAEYLEVLDRQSQRLKKLTEDLVEASKASSGAMTLQLARTDVAELLNQAVGEYTQRLEAAGVAPIVTVPEGEVAIFADGQHLWRVFDNLLSNICKYALPGTRAYFSVKRLEGDVVILVRNISARELNISADELMERFVRGDASRSTEGSGLGLSIAQSLTELMGGSFEIVLDGDLFKVVITFPAYQYQMTENN